MFVLTARSVKFIAMHAQEMAISTQRQEIIDEKRLLQSPLRTTFSTLLTYHEI